MLSPSELDLLQQDLKMALSVVGLDELEDANALLVQIGFPPNDFQFGEESDPSPAYPAPITGRIQCIRISMDRRQVYDAGHESSWLCDFERDLRSGHFGPQPNRL